MDSSSDEETTFTHRKSSTKKIYDSDEEAEEAIPENATEATEDFKLHLSDDDGEDKCSDASRVEKDADDVIAPCGKSEGRSDEEPSAKTMISPAQHSASDSDTGNFVKRSPSPVGTSAAEDIRKKLNALADSDSESDIDTDLQPLLKSTNKIKGSKSRLDSDSKSPNFENSDVKKEKNTTSKSRKNKSGPERKSKTNAKNAMLEIKAESQRRLRESNIGLPYHVPKQRSLLDFLSRRKTSSHMPIKGPSEQLVEVWKEIEEREKEVEEFYKSESEHESETEGSDHEANVGTGTIESKQSAEPIISEGHCEDRNSVNSVASCEENSLETTIGLSQNSETTDETLQETNTLLNSGPISVDQQLVNETDQPSGDPPIIDDRSVSIIEDSAALKDHSSSQILTGVEKISGTNNSDNSKVEADSVVNGIGISNIQPPKTLVPFHTQDSQDISLQLSEIQSFSDDVKILKEDEGIASNAGKVICKASLNNAVSTGGDKNSKTWIELNSEMKLLHDENSDAEDSSVKEGSSRKDSTLWAGPRLSLKGAPDDFIDLDDTSSIQPNTPGVQGLIERFMKHSGSKKKNNRAQTVELSLISSEKDDKGDVLEVKHEAIKIVLTGEDNSRSVPTPGARLKLLKSELNKQMRKQKEEEWQKKQEEMRNEKNFLGEENDCGLLPDEEEEEEEMTDSEAESEPEINDIREPRKKKRIKGLFVDEEAEVEDDDNASRGSEDDDDNEYENEHVEDDNADDSERDNDEELWGKKEKMHGENERGDNELDENLPVQNTAFKNSPIDKENDTPKPRSLQRTLTSASDLFASQSTEWREDDDDDFLPAGQPNRLTCRESVNQKDDDISMQFSPLTLSLKGTQGFLDADQELTPPKSSWPSECKSQNSIKKLFTEPQPSSTQEKLDELAQLFGAKFNDSEVGVSALVNTSCTEDSEMDLMALCSGKFVSQLPQPKDLEDDSGKSLNSQFLSQDPNEGDSQRVKLATEDSVDFSLKWDGDMKTGEEDDGSKGKFRLEIISSDDDDDDEAVSIKEKKRKKNRKLEFSDDEEDSVPKTVSDHELSDDDEDDDDNDIVTADKETKLFGIFSKEPKEVFYDSDENEIDPAAFLEKEAELSEEEDWHGSDDEDEKGLDKLEMNEADKEDIDQDLVREQLVKSHMQKMLDEDRRDVRILQEMLLEDGELHSENGGRERQFRWRNVDSTGMVDDGHKSDEENVDHDEDEDDAEWRKQRHEREMFLKEQREASFKQKKEAGEFEENDDDLENSGLMLLGKSVLFKSRSSSIDASFIKEPPAAKLPCENNLLSPDRKLNVLLSKRGSFLSRGDGVLAKLAKITGPAKESVLAGAKSSGNFVFSAISPPKKQIKHEDVETKPAKRKAPAGLENPTDKKPCLLPAAKKRSGLFDHL
ncbi:Claspin [Frankliniella fusca]|uniref:Claspin n=1 Tax=Frankliniella fusca TaxID=407009 RepID=A0AAE1HQU5_9NEOP|nr:Claspin [Frankliniella fusca]